MQLVIQSSVEFEHLLDALANELVDANIHFKLYDDITGRIAEFQQELNQSNTFWSLTFQAHLDASVFRLCKIYDQNSRSLNLRNLLDTINGNLGIFDQANFRERLKDNPYVESLSADSRKPDEPQLQQDLRFVSDDNSLVKNLTVWRNNFFAHRSTNHVIKKGDLSGNYPLTISDVESLLVEGMRILNRYSSLFRASTYSTNIIGRDDYRFVLESVRANLALMDSRVEEELRRFSKNDS